MIYLDFDIISDLEYMSINYPTIAHFRHFRHFKHFSSLFTNEYQISTKDYVRIYKLFMQNKANFRNAKNGVCACVTMRYGNLDALIGRKTNPIQTQNKPNLTQFKAKTNPISNRVSVHGHRETQITFDLAIGLSIESYVTQKTSVTTEIMRKVITKAKRAYMSAKAYRKSLEKDLEPLTEMLRQIDREDKQKAELEELMNTKKK